MNNKIETSQQLYQVLRGQIQTGELKGKLSSIADFTRNFEISHNTVKKAIDQLKAYGLVYGQQGKGVYVVEDNLPVKTRGKVVIGIQIGALRNPFYLHVLNDLRDLLGEHDFQSRIANTAAELIREAADAVILLDVKINDFEWGMLEKRYGRRRIISVNRPIPGTTVVANDNFAGGMLAMEYLYGKGHRKIGIISRDLEIRESIFDYRYRGVQEFVKRHPDMEIYNYCITITPHVEIESSAEVSTGELLAAKPDLTAIFAFTDVIALGILSVLQRKGIRVPEDISLLSFDNRDFSSLLNPPLTTIEEPAELIALKTFELLDSQFTNAAAENEQIYYPPKLVERDSVCAPLDKNIQYTKHIKEG